MKIDSLSKLPADKSAHKRYNFIAIAVVGESETKPVTIKELTTA